MYAVAMKVKINIKPQNEQNLFRIGKDYPFLIHTYASWSQKLQRVLIRSEIESSSTFFYKSKVFVDQ